MRSDGVGPGGTPLLGPLYRRPTGGAPSPLLLFTPEGQRQRPEGPSKKSALAEFSIPERKW